MEQIHPFAIDKLMEQTRKVAVSYHQTTGKALPISNELARFDAQKILSLTALSVPEKGVDFLGGKYLPEEKILVKSRVIFNHQRSGYRMGALNMDGHWTVALLLIYNDQYVPDEIYLAEKSSIQELLSQSQPSKNGFSIAKFKAIGTLFWDSVNGVSAT